MISLNLLPDIKKEYLKSQRTTRMFVLGSFIISSAAIAVVILIALYVFGVQKLQISSSQGTIDESILMLEQAEDLDKMVTIQNQLTALPSLHEGKTATKNLFSFLTVITPNDVNLNSVDVDFVTNTIEIQGGGEDFKAVNIFVDTLKNASYVYADNQDSSLAFSAVVLDTIGKTDESSNFKITLTFNPIIFDNTISGLKMSVPNITSTRSQTEKPKSLFDGTIPDDEEEAN